MKMNERYRERCLRNMGIMDEAGLARVKSTSIAIGGLGLGGSVFINLVKMGFENFHVADPDIYERTNINRQRAAKETTVGSRKDDCLIQEAIAINPDVRIRAFREGVSEENVGQFLEGMDWVVDAVDVFAIPAKLALHEECRRRKLPVISCVAVGFGAAFVAFDPSTPSFAELTGLLKDAPYAVNIDRFVKSMMPEIPEYMSEQVAKALRRESHIPFVVPGVEVSAALVTTEIAKNILGLGEAIRAPDGLYFNPIDFRFERFEARHAAVRAITGQRKAA